jgi:hydroxymethylglutaryl-CoA synthase
LNPPYEDTVTMSANAARPILTEEDKEQIGLLIVGTEGSVDFGKPISTNVHSALGLPPNVRNYETKHACYSGVAALDVAIDWIAAGHNHGKKALIIATDFSRKHFHKSHEFVLGGVSAAMLISDTPRVIAVELKKKGVWTTDVYDTFRPSATAEEGNNEVSLYSYMDALEGSFLDYVKYSGPTDIDHDFKHMIYHMPFPGMAFQAHRLLCNLAKPRKKAEVRESFNQKTLPSLRYAQRVGSTYGASNFVGLCGLIKSAPDLAAGDRIGIFSYGSGAIGEFYSAVILPEAKEEVEKRKIDEAFDARKEVQEYEHIENLRVSNIEKPDFVPDFTVADNWYEKHYQGQNYLVLKQVKDYCRIYEWS